MSDSGSDPEDDAASIFSTDSHRTDTDIFPIRTTTGTGIARVAPSPGEIRLRDAVDAASGTARAQHDTDQADNDRRAPFTNPKQQHPLTTPCVN
ncbi:hypothetical protein ABZX40_39170 [Streptomyces sp. NPDC004610]|uniref:hypothetical protein n=1 Tax=unclassified Streptomyces TaxID=2593676 RepID=UPI0033A44D06